MTPYRGPPLTLGDAAAANLRFMVWCKACRTVFWSISATRARTRTMPRRLVAGTAQLGIRAAICSREDSSCRRSVFCKRR